MRQVEIWIAKPFSFYTKSQKVANEIVKHILKLATESRQYERYGRAIV